MASEIKEGVRLYVSKEFLPKKGEGLGIIALAFLFSAGRVTEVCDLSEGLASLDAFYRAVVKLAFEVSDDS